MRHDYLKIPSKIQTYKNTLEHKHSLYPYIAILFPYKEKALPCMVWRSHVADVPRMRNNDSIKNTQIHDPPLIHSNSWPPTPTPNFMTHALSCTRIVMTHVKIYTGPLDLITDLKAIGSIFRMASQNWKHPSLSHISFLATFLHQRNCSNSDVYNGYWKYRVGTCWKF